MKSKETKQREAKFRNEKWAALSSKQQLSNLDHRGLVAKKQRIKIQRKIDENSQSQNLSSS